ncbi:hypothetical protein [Candidatus Venteria ishoeyi]|uniref:RiboL-PSP-HEPN domain-containing protein n=1 Tax=Candidatus Venteria ishoeyi TaxID=1899563 RepID=A0A1H6FEG7_9GAMM|nr:hypothetical protein [Candidatus Venteria ishoeyi]MDM8546242.1 hypothetical protein [Candidatus Venteria ishoeyi]SEH07414.1 Uncharacterised protein [Candidatus Venteria ishoeyi]
MSIEKIYDDFCTDISAIEQLSDINVENKAHLERLLYANVITLMETYLMDTFKYAISSDDNLKKIFIEKYLKFKSEKINVNNIYKTLNSIEENYILGTSGKGMLFHNRRNIIVYLIVIDLQTPAELTYIYSAISKRHDIVHRNGKNIRDEKTNLTSPSLNELISEMKGFIEKLHNKLITLDIPDST